MQNFKPHLKTPRPLLTIPTCTICNTALPPLTAPTTKHCTPCKERIHKLNQKLNQIKQTNENNTSNNTIITDNHTNPTPYNSNTTKGI